MEEYPESWYYAGGEPEPEKCTETKDKCFRFEEDKRTPKFKINTWKHKNKAKSPDIVHKYQHMKEIKNVMGFIVNIHDATNFDIDLDISSELNKQYKNVISNEYTYQDLDDSYFKDPNSTKLIKLNPKNGITYRCRLKGIGIHQLNSSLDIWKANQMCVEIKQLIDRTDGWIICNLSDIDVYQRMLVDIIINTSSGFINLKNYILTRMKEEEHPIFYSYSSRRHRNFVK